MADSNAHRGEAGVNNIIPGIFLPNRRSITVTLLQDETAAVLHWPVNVADACHPVLVSSLVYGAPAAPDAQDSRSPWHQAMTTSWSVELTKKILNCEITYGQERPPAVIDASGQICTLPRQLQY